MRVTVILPNWIFSRIVLLNTSMWKLCCRRVQQQWELTLWKVVRRCVLAPALRSPECHAPGPRLTPEQIEAAEAAIHAMMSALADDLSTLGLEHGDA